jgi:hypothetical protein
MSTQAAARTTPEEEVYRSRTAASRQYFVEARKYLPGGDSRSTLFSRHRLFLGLFNDGILIDPRGVGNLSTVLGDQEVGQFSAALRRVLSRVAT